MSYANTLNTKAITKKIFSLSIPMALTQLMTIGSIFLCMAMVATLGKDVLAASALIISTRVSIMLIGGSILFSLSILIGHAYGQKEYSRIGNFMQQGWTLALIISIPVMIIFWHIDTILIRFGQSKAISEIVRIFFHANIWNVLPFLFAICNQQLCYGTRKQRIDLVANIIVVIVQLSLSYLLIFGHFGLPKLGVAGLGYAMSIAGWCYFLFTTYVIYASDFFKRFNLFKYRVHHEWHYFMQMLKVGWPICMQIGGEMLSFFIAATMIGWLGVTALAAYQVVSQYVFLVVVPLFALAQASGVLVGQAHGEKNYHEIKYLGRISILFAIVITIIVGIIFLLFPKTLASFYINIHDQNNAQIIRLITILFAIVALTQFFDGIRNVLTGSLRGLFDTKFPMYIGLFVIWLIGLPLGYLLAFHFHLGVVGIAIGSAIGMMLGAFILIYRWRKLIKKFDG